MDPITEMYISQALHGLAYGMLLFLMASGLTLIFGMMDVLNIAHGAFFMLAAYLCYQVMDWTGNFWLSLAVAPLFVSALGLLVERFLLRRVKATGLGHVGQLLLTLGLALIITEMVVVLWSDETRQVMVPLALKGLVKVGGMSYPVYRLFVIGLALAILALMAGMLYLTRLGKIVRAAVYDPDMVSALGINMPLVFSLVFGMGTWMAGVAGVAGAPLLTVFPGLANQMLMDTFVVVVVGGFGSLTGAFVVSIFLGELNAYGIQFIPRLAPVLTFGFMALVLSFKPTGFFGERQ
jgi:branched-chain amino acid transport system permease protein